MNYIEEKVKFSISEVIGYLEGKIENGVETAEEMIWYEWFKWDGVVVKDEVLRGLLDEMKAEWNQ